MRYDPQANPTDVPQVGTRRRKSGRLDLEYLACQYGSIVNLSAGGMCIICRKGPAIDEEMVLDIYGLPDPLQIKARCAWKKRAGLFKQEIGFQFQEVTPAMAKKLTSVATSNRIKRTM